jgi:hypothetical protein
MSFSDLPFAYGPFVPHHIPKQYVESYFSHHELDSSLSLSTTVEDVSIKNPNRTKEKWKLTLRKHDSVRQVDVWWEDEFDAVVFANGHYSVPFVQSLCFPSQIYLTSMAGPRSQRPRPIPRTLSRPSSPLQNLPHTAPLQKQENPHNWQLRFRNRPYSRPPVISPSAHLPIPPLSLPRGWTHSTSWHRMEARHQRIPPLRTNYIRRQ